MTKHLKVAAILNIIYHSIILVITLFFLMLFGLGVLVSYDIDSYTSAIIFAATVGGFSVIFSTLGIVSGIGLFQAKEWAWILTIVISSINLLAFPFGTALGIYTLKVMFSREAIVYLARADKKVFVRQDA